MNLISQKMGISEWSYHNDYNPASRQKMQHVDLVRRFEELDIEVELGFDAGTDRARSAALPELRYRDRLSPRPNASNATPASISARFPVLRSPATPRRKCCGSISPLPQSIRTRRSTPPNRFRKPAA